MFNRKKLSEKSRIDDLDFSFDNAGGDYKDFNFEFGSDTSAGNRSPVSKVREGASTFLSSAAKTTTSGLRARIDSDMPDATKFISDIGTFTSDIKYLSTELQKDLTPALQEMKRAGRALGPKVKMFLPKKLQDKYDKWTADNKDQEKVATMSKAKSEEMAMTASLENIFSKNVGQQIAIQQAQYEEDKSEKIIDRSLTAQRHGQSFQQLQRINIATSFHQKFIEDIQIPFMKKDMELKYRQFYIAKDSLTTLKGIGKILEKKLDEIRHNVSLPETQKITLLETVKERNQKKIGDVGSAYMSRILEKVINPFKDMVEMASSGVGMAADQFENDNEYGGSSTKTAMIAQLLGSQAGKQLDKILAKTAFGKAHGGKGVATKAMARINHMFKNAGIRFDSKLRDINDANPDSMLGILAGILAPDQVQGMSKASNRQVTLKPNDPATLTNQAVLSLTTIMPGLLSKIAQSTEMMATGKNAEEWVYDTKSNDFIRSSTFAKRVKQDALGTKQSRTYANARMVGEVKGLHQAKNGKEDFDEIQRDLTIFLRNLGLFQIAVNPLHIAALAGYGPGASDRDTFEESWAERLGAVVGNKNETEWIEKAFGGVREPLKLAKVLYSIAFDKEGKVDNISLNSLQSVAAREYGRDAMIPVLQQYIDSGHARYMKDIISSSGGQFSFNERAILDHLADADYSSDSYKSSVSSVASSSKTSHEQLIGGWGFKEIAEDPTWNKTIAGKMVKTIFDKMESGEGKPKLPEKLKTALQEIAPGAFSALERVENKLGGAVTDAAKKLQEAKERTDRRKARSSQYGDELDPYLNERVEMLQASGALGSLPANMIAAMINPMPSAAVGVSVGYASQPQFKGEIPVVVKNIKDIAEQFASSVSRSMTTAVSSGKGSSSVSTVQAITRFEETFKEFASTQMHLPDILSKILEANIGLSGQLDSLMGNTTGTLKKLWGGTKSGFGYAWGKLKNLRPPAGLGKTILDGSLNTASTILKGTKDAVSGLGKGAWSLGKGAASGLGSMAVNGFLGTVGMLGSIGGFSERFRDSMGDFRERMSGKWSSAKAKAKARKPKFVDIYRKGEVTPGKPLLSATKQESGDVFFIKTGKPIKRSSSIDEPVGTEVDGVLKTLITEEDIEHGLVDVNDKPISSSGMLKGLGGALSGILGGMGKGILGIGKGLLGGVNPILGLLQAVGGFGLKGIGALGRGIGTAGKRLFGIQDNATREDLESVVGSRLDTIISIMRGEDSKTTTTHGGKSRGVTPGDMDGDGDADTIYEDRLNSERKEKEEAEEKRKHDYYKDIGKIADEMGGNEKAKKPSIWGKLLGVFSPMLGILTGIGSAVAGVFGLLTGIPGFVMSLPGMVSGVWRSIITLGGILGGKGAADAMAGDIGADGKPRRGRGGRGGRGVGGRTPGRTPGGAAGRAGRGIRTGAGAKIGRMFGNIFGGGKAKMLGKAALGLGTIVGGGALLGSMGGTASDAWAGADPASSTVGGMHGAINGNAGNAAAMTGMVPGAIPGGVGGDGGSVGEYDGYFDESQKGTANDNWWDRTKGFASGAWDTAKDMSGVTDFGNAWTALTEGRYLDALGNTVSGVASAGMTAAAVIGGGTTAAVIGGAALLVGAADEILFDGAGRDATLNYLGVWGDEMAEERCKMYGVNTKFKVGVGEAADRMSNWGESALSTLIRLEDVTYAMLKKGTKMTNEKAAYWTEEFHLSGDVPAAVTFWLSWYRYKFIPIFKAYIDALEKEGLTYDKAKGASGKQKNNILNHISSICKSEIGNRLLCLSEENYKIFRESIAMRVKDKSKARKQEDKENLLADAGHTSNALIADDAQGRLEGAAATVVRNSMGGANSTNGKIDTSSLQALLGQAQNHSDPAIRRMFRGGGYSAAEHAAARGSSGTNADGKVDPNLNRISPPKAPPALVLSASEASAAGGIARVGNAEGALGSHIKEFESGNKNSTAIGYDRVGGTSYGTYQLSSRAGSLKEFLEFAVKEGGAFGKQLKMEMDQAGEWNTMSKRGAAVDVWLKYARAEGGKPMKALEDKFFQVLKFGVALKGVRNPKVRELITTDRGVQEAFFSTMVQHGPYRGGGRGAPAIFDNSYKDGMSVEEFLTAVYNNRATRFGSSTKAIQQSAVNRFKRELPKMIALSQRSKSSGTGTWSASSVNTSGVATGMTVPKTGTSSGSTSGTTGTGMVATGSTGSSNPSKGDVKKGWDALVKTARKGTKLDGLLPQMKHALGAANFDFMKETGKSIYVSSGFRSMEDQARLKKKYGAGAASPNPLAPHIAGVAVDISSDQALRAERLGILDKHNLHLPLKNWSVKPEPWHVEIKGARPTTGGRITKEGLATVNAMAIPDSAGTTGSDDTGMGEGTRKISDTDMEKESANETMDKPAGTPSVDVNMTASGASGAAVQSFGAGASSASASTSTGSSASGSSTGSTSTAPAVAPTVAATTTPKPTKSIPKTIDYSKYAEMIIKILESMLKAQQELPGSLGSLQASKSVEPRNGPSVPPPTATPPAFTGTFAGTKTGLA